jgi:RNA recognition motif-containing protein
MDAPKDTSNARVVVITNLTRNVAEVHLRAVFGYYGEITKVDLPLYAKCEYSKIFKTNVFIERYGSWPKPRQGIS